MPVQSYLYKAYLFRRKLLANPYTFLLVLLFLGTFMILSSAALFSITVAKAQTVTELTGVPSSFACSQQVGGGECAPTSFNGCNPNQPYQMCWCDGPIIGTYNGRIYHSSFSLKALTNNPNDSCGVSIPTCNNDKAQCGNPFSCGPKTTPTPTPPISTTIPPTSTPVTPTPTATPGTYRLGLRAYCDDNNTQVLATGHISGPNTNITTNTDGSLHQVGGLGTYSLSCDNFSNYNLKEGSTSYTINSSSSSDYEFSCHYTNCGTIPVQTTQPPVQTTTASPGQCVSLTVPNYDSNAKKTVYSTTNRQMPTTSIYQTGDVPNNGYFLNVYRSSQAWVDGHPETDGQNPFDITEGIKPAFSGTQPTQYYIHYAAYSTKGSPTWSSFAPAVNINSKYNPTIPMLAAVGYYDPNVYAFGYLITNSASTPSVNPPAFVGDTSVNPCYTFVYIRRPMCTNINLTYAQNSTDGTHTKGQTIANGSTVVTGDQLTVGPISWNDSLGNSTTLHPTYNWSYRELTTNGSDTGYVNFGHTNESTILSIIPTDAKNVAYTILTFDDSGRTFVMGDSTKDWYNPGCIIAVNVVKPTITTTTTPPIPTTPVATTTPVVTTKPPVTTTTVVTTTVPVTTPIVTTTPPCTTATMTPTTTPTAKPCTTPVVTTTPPCTTGTIMPSSTTSPIATPCSTPVVTTTGQILGTSVTPTPTKAPVLANTGQGNVIISAIFGAFIIITIFAMRYVSRFRYQTLDQINQNIWSYYTQTNTDPFEAMRSSVVNALTQSNLYKVTHKDTNPKSDRLI